MNTNETTKLVVIDYNRTLYRLVYKCIEKALERRIEQYAENNKEIYSQRKGSNPQEIVNYYTHDFLDEMVKKREDASMDKTEAEFYLLKRFIRSALNARGNYSVFKKNFGVNGEDWNSIKTLRKANSRLVDDVLYSFDIGRISRKTPNTLKREFEKLSKKKFGDKSVIANLCQTIIEACKFIKTQGGAISYLNKIEDQLDPKKHNDGELEQNKETLIKQIDGIHGFGEALSNDFFKDMGFPNFSKPDTHIMKIIDQLNIHLYAEWGSSPEERAQKLIKYIAQSVGKDTTENQVDKIFWMWRSGVLSGLADLGTLKEEDFEEECGKIRNKVLLMVKKSKE